MALFRSTSNGQSHFVEMKAGKMFRDGTWVYPDSRKGSLYIYRNSDDLMHFCWRDRTTMRVEDDFIIFPGDCTYSKVKQCTTGRVYVLKFENSTVRMFYWLQEPKTDKDDEHCRRINYFLNNSLAHSPFNITQAHLSRIFGPEVAAQLSALMETEENSRFVDRSNTRNKILLDTETKHFNTPLSENDDKEQQKNLKKSNIKIINTAESSNEKDRKQTKNVTINEKDKLENGEDETLDEEDDYIDKGDTDENIKKPD